MQRGLTGPDYAAPWERQCDVELVQLKEALGSAS